ncbi:MAG: hypothetical protein BroJett006_08680 [Betaproteobacteria bacterium]|nr:MAG: hypothetical protein BroJett006_08680 [Betaproteobacteria bacterium]
MTRQGNEEDLRQRRRVLKFPQLIEGMGDFGDLRHHDTALKFWLPEPAEQALNELADYYEESMSEMLRQFFAMHCYGVYAFIAMNEAMPDLFSDTRGGVRFSEGGRDAEPPLGKKRVDTYWVPELGKNVAPIKVWIPGRIRGDLQILADHVGIKLSQYVREIVISRLLGHGTLPMRPEMLTAIPSPSAEDWCEGKEVPYREVSYEEYLKSPEGKEETEWMDL